MFDILIFIISSIFCFVFILLSFLFLNFKPVFTNNCVCVCVRMNVMENVCSGVSVIVGEIVYECVIRVNECFRLQRLKNEVKSRINSRDEVTTFLIILVRPALNTRCTEYVAGCMCVAECEYIENVLKEVKSYARVHYLLYELMSQIKKALLKNEWDEWKYNICMSVRVIEISRRVIRVDHGWGLSGGLHITGFCNMPHDDG